jgi:hypothetical protein
MLIVYVSNKQRLNQGKDVSGRIDSVLLDCIFLIRKDLATKKIMAYKVNETTVADSKACRSDLTRVSFSTDFRL